MSNDRDTTSEAQTDLQESCSRSDESQHRGSVEGESGVAADAAGANLAVGTDDDGGEQTRSKVDNESGKAVVDASPGDPKLVKTEASERTPLSPVVAMRAKLSGGLRNILAARSDAQVSPASPPRAAIVDTAGTPAQHREPGTKRLSPLPWNRLKAGRREKEVVPESFVGDNPEEGLGNDHHNRSPSARVIPKRPEDGQAGTARGVDTSGTLGAIRASEGERHDSNAPPVDKDQPHDGGEHRNATVGEEDLEAGMESTSDAGPGHDRSSNKPGTAPRPPPAAGATVAEKAPSALARDNTLILRDEWPELLDNEADPTGWALDKGEDEVLAAARRTGSVLVRVVTWNLHAKPTPEADKLREALLPPGKATHNAVFAHRAIIPLLRNVRSAAVATGLSLGSRSPTLGNKGGVGISFDIGATSCVFVNSHLAAHQDNVRERNDHFFQISEGLARELAPPDFRSGIAGPSGGRGDPNVAEGLGLATAPASPFACGHPPSGTTGFLPCLH
ncbi:unnamed protein product [Scytosiphon promiscuus]